MSTFETDEHLRATAAQRSRSGQLHKSRRMHPLEATTSECYLTLFRTLDMSGGMDTSNALAGLSALAQESRLKIFRLLVQRGPEGMAAGDIARNLKLPHNTLSSHLGILSRASLVKSRKESRSIIYSVDLKGTRDLLTFLVQDCCRGRPEVCEPLIASALAECC
jgi:ArsR family transcriptional regulator, arsenate/arsenite/antimonite-responsive transcriptional repressor